MRTPGVGGSATAPPAGGVAGVAAASATASAGLLGTGAAYTLGLGRSRTIVGLATRRALARGTLSQHQLERTVAQLHQCLDELGAEQRRVLSLRAGLGPRPALSRTQVAQRLDLGVAQTRRLERRGLRRLGALDGAGRCGSEAAAASSLFGGSMLVPPAAFVVAGLADDASGQPRYGVEGVSQSGGGDGGGGLSLPPPIGDGSDWTLLIMLALAAMLALLVRRELKRH